jgi:hypothetical protein
MEPGKILDLGKASAQTKGPGQGGHEGAQPKSG